MYFDNDWTKDFVFKKLETMMISNFFDLFLDQYLFRFEI